MISHAALFAAVFAALYAAHHLGDQWIQTHCQALTKGRDDWSGRLACTRHVLTITITKAAMLTITALALDLRFAIGQAALALTLDAVSHYWADRRVTLAKLAALINKTEYYALGAPRAGHDDNPSTGTGAFHLDQSFHIFWIWVTALIIAI